jgi:hypothetical protein
VEPLRGRMSGRFLTLGCALEGDCETLVSSLFSFTFGREVNGPALSHTPGIMLCVAMGAKQWSQSVTG